MFKSKLKKLTISGLMIPLGVLIPFFAFHSLGVLPGSIFLPMHIPVLLCGFFCGPLFGAICGFVLPYLNSLLIGMPLMYPNAVVISCELLTYGLMSGFLYKHFHFSNKLRYIYPTLVISLISGRIVYGAVAALLMFFNPSVSKLSVITATVTGLPGIAVQLILIPKILLAVHNSIAKSSNAKSSAVRMVQNNEATCVVVKSGDIVSAESTKGIAYIIDLYEKQLFKDTFVADTVIGKAASMVFSAGGVKECYGHVMSAEALSWLSAHGIKASYGTLTQSIQNRKGDGTCPMEATVADINDEKTAITLLKYKVEELRKQSINN